MSDSITISGHSVPVADAQRLVTTLIVDGTPTALGVANRLTTCLQMNVEVDLDAQERATVLAVLEDPPDGLTMLRGALMRDARWIATDLRRLAALGAPGRVVLGLNSRISSPWTCPSRQGQGQGQGVVSVQALARTWAAR